MSRSLLAAILLLVLVAGAWAQSDGTGSGDPPLVADAEPYERDEFPSWALSLRRAEIVALGSLPVSLLASRLLYGLVRFAGQSISTGTLASASVPGFAQSSDVAPAGRRENLQILGGAAWISIMIAVADYALGEYEQSNE